MQREKQIEDHAGGEDGVYLINCTAFNYHHEWSSLVCSQTSLNFCYFTKLSAVSIYLHPFPSPVPQLIHNNPFLSLPSSIEAYSYTDMSRPRALNCKATGKLTLCLFVRGKLQGLTLVITRCLIRECNWMLKSHCLWPPLARRVIWSSQTAWQSYQPIQ